MKEYTGFENIRMNESLKKTKNLININWSSIVIDDKNFPFKLFIGTENTFEILFFDFINFRLYYLNQTEDEIVELCKVLNPSLEVTVPKILEHLKSNLLDNNQKSLFSIKTDKSHYVKIKMESKLAGIKFNWEFKLDILDNVYLKHHLVVPLIFNCAEYQQRELELIKIIQAKDKELDDYKSQGVTLARKYLSTETFDSKHFDNNFKNKIQTLDFIKSPQKCLNTNLHQKIHESCVEKYYKNIFEDNNASTNKKISPKSDKSSSEETSKEKLIEPSVSSQKESKREEINKLLTQDTSDITNKAINKKKKLF